MRKKEPYEKRKNTTVSISLNFPITIDGGVGNRRDDNEFQIFADEIGFKQSEEFFNYLVQSSGLTKSEFIKRAKESILKVANLNEDFSGGRGFRKYWAEKIIEEHPRKEVKERMREYVKTKSYF